MGLQRGRAFSPCKIWDSSVLADKGKEGLTSAEDSEIPIIPLTGHWGLASRAHLARFPLSQRE